MTVPADSVTHGEQTLVLDRPVRATGHVLDRDGRAIPWATVRAISTRAEAVAVVTTDQAGSFVLSSNAPIVAIDASAEGFADGGAAIGKASADIALDLSLDQECALRVRVVDGAGVCISAVQTAGERNRSRSETSDASGRGRIGGLGRGEAMISRFASASPAMPAGPATCASNATRRPQCSRCAALVTERGTPARRHHRGRVMLRETTEVTIVLKRRTK